MSSLISGTDCLAGLQDRLDAIRETNSKVRDLINKLTISGSDGAPVDDLAAEIGHLIREQEDDVELLSEEVADLRVYRSGTEPEKQRVRLKEDVAELMRELPR